MKLTLEGIKNTTVFQKAGILLPGYDVAAVSKKQSRHLAGHTLASEIFSVSLSVVSPTVAGGRCT